jgi:hypothetical protein
MDIRGVKDKAKDKADDTLTLLLCLTSEARDSDIALTEGCDGNHRASFRRSLSALQRTARFDLILDGGSTRVIQLLG